MRLDWYTYSDGLGSVELVLVGSRILGKMARLAKCTTGGPVMIAHFLRAGYEKRKSGEFDNRREGSLRSY
jgi:hypothetical protein